MAIVEKKFQLVEKKIEMGKIEPEKVVPKKVVAEKVLTEYKKKAGGRNHLRVT
jgi:hypothetical protein